MRVLVVDPDDGIAAEFASSVTSAGFEVVHASSPEQMSAHLRVKAFDAVLVDLSLRRMNGFDVARELRMTHSEDELEIILMSPRHKPGASEIVSLMKDTGARYFFLKPLNYQEVFDGLKVPRPLKPKSPTVVSSEPNTSESTATAQPNAVRSAPPTATPKKKKKLSKRRDINWENVKELVSIWIEKRTGTLVLAGESSGSAPVIDGGVVDDDGRAIVKAALLGGVVAFRESHVEGQGDWMRTGRILFKGARSGVDGRTLRRYSSAVAALTEHGDLARSLPIRDATRQFIRRMDGELTVLEIMEREDLPVGEVSKDVVALVRMEFISLQRDSGAAKQEVKEREPSASQASLQGMNRAAIRDAHMESDPDKLFNRLEKEFATIRQAAPPVVLGIPADSDRNMVDRAAVRMRQRYAEIVAKRDISDDVRQLALEIAKRVDQAHRHFNFDQQISTGNHKANTIGGDDVSRMLENGRRFISDKAWVQADEVLAKAHAKRIDNVPVLANLGWARLHNPDLDLDVRTEEGKDFLLLAEQFDPMDADGQYFLAQVLVASGRLDAAEERAGRAVKAMPGDKARQTLLRKIKILRQQAEDAAR